MNFPIAVAAAVGEGPSSRHLPITLRPDPSRVVLRPFVPADNPFPSEQMGRSRITRVIKRVLDLPEEQLELELNSVQANLQGRHRDVERVFNHRFHEMVGPEAELGPISPMRALLIGAYLSEEYSFAAAALFNPSITPHPDQSGVPTGFLRFILSLRAIGEGHVSSITFRTGLIGPEGEVELALPGRLAISPRTELIPGGSPDDPGVRLHSGCCDDLSEIVLFPVTFQQRHGLEDLRLTRFVDEDGSVTYYGTYTAVGGEAIRQELLRTTRFETFELQAIGGPFSATKGMALFPRRIGGYYTMLGRQDHENIWILKSNDLYRWDDGMVAVAPRWPWEFVQIGNCGAPVEIEEGWLVLTHGVGSVRNYCIGACLLAKNDPSKLLARTSEPVITPTSKERDGYVPSVVYSCGFLVHGRMLLVPYGVADTFTRFALIDLDRLLEVMS